MKAYKRVATTSTKSATELVPSRNSRFQHWIWEFIAAALSIGSLVALILLLAFENKRPLSAWDFPLSLNTVVATLGTVSRSSLAFAVSACIGQQKWSWFHSRQGRISLFGHFDEASKGPLGASKLLLDFKMRYCSLSY